MKALLVVVLALAVVPAAHGKGCARIETTSPLIAGKRATITLTTLMPTYGPDGSLRATEPYVDGIVAMSLYVKPRFGLPVLLPLARNPRNRSEWRARFRFWRAGTWTLTSTATPPGLPSGCAGAKRVFVRPS